MKIPELTWPAEQRAYDDDLLAAIQPGTVTLLIRGRNAWNSTWVRHYLRNATLYTDTQSAKNGAESQRGPGNVFYVIDAPALLLIGQQSNVVLSDAHPDNPFGAFTGLRSTVVQSVHGAWVDGLFPGISVRDAVSLFRHNSGHWFGPLPSQHSLRTGRLDSPSSFQVQRVTLQSLVSRPVGSKYLLQWDGQKNGNRYTRRGTNLVAKGWSDVLETVCDGDDSQTACGTHVRRHREEVLRAMPKSQWLAKQTQLQAEKKARKQAAYALWDFATDRLAELEDAVLEAEGERRIAQQARMKLAETSAGVRAQRDRLEAAVAEEKRLTEEHVQAEEAANQLWIAYTQA